MRNEKVGAVVLISGGVYMCDVLRWPQIDIMPGDRS